MPLATDLSRLTVETGLTLAVVQWCFEAQCKDTMTCLYVPWQYIVIPFLRCMSNVVVRYNPLDLLRIAFCNIFQESGCCSKRNTSTNCLCLHNTCLQNMVACRSCAVV